jgi:4-hydroxy-tetrahydrodipicolinate synthase
MRVPHQFRGLSVALATPLTQQGHIDFDSWVRFLEFQIQGGVDHLVVCGTTGESPTITDDEYAQLLEVAIATANKRVSVVAGSGTNDTRHAIKRSRIAEEAGADGLLVVSPYYNKPPQRGLIAHYTAIADVVDLPIIVYNVPGRTGSNILPETVVAMSAHPNIVAIKEASGDMNQILKLLSIIPDDITVLAGDDSMTLPVMAAGGHGVVSVAANVFPQQMSQLLKTIAQGDWKLASDSVDHMIAFFNYMFVESNPIPVKAALAYHGHMENVLRLPLQPLDQTYWPELEKHIKKIEEVKGR